MKSVGLSKSVKSIIHSNVPDLTNYQDISDFVMKGSFASESDVEDMDSKVNIPSKGKSESNVQQRAIKLVEIGPRLSLRLAKIQDGLCQGEIVHHEFVVKSSSEIVALKEKKKAVEDERARRRAEQERNVTAKELANSKSKPDEADSEVSDAGSDGDSNEGDDAMSQDEGITNE